jgi:hypothetical protein
MQIAIGAHTIVDFYGFRAVARYCEKLKLEELKF